MNEKIERELATSMGRTEDDYERERNYRIKQLGLPSNATDDQIDLAFKINHLDYVHSQMIKSEISY